MAWRAVVEPREVAWGQHVLVWFHATGSQPEFGVRPDADKPQRLCIGLLVNEHQVGSQMAVAEVGPRAAERVVMVARFKCIVVGERLNNHR